MGNSAVSKIYGNILSHAYEYYVAVSSPIITLYLVFVGNCDMLFNKVDLFALRWGFSIVMVRKGPTRENTEDENASKILRVLKH